MLVLLKQKRHLDPAPQPSNAEIERFANAVNAAGKALKRKQDEIEEDYNIKIGDAQESAFQKIGGTAIAAGVAVAVLAPGPAKLLAEKAVLAGALVGLVWGANDLYTAYRKGARDF